MKSVSDWLKNRGVIAIAIIWVIIGFVLLVGYWASTWRGWNWQALNWQVLTGFATWVLAGGIFFAIRQIAETRKDTNAQLAVQLFEALREDEAMDTLQRIYRLGPTYSTSFVENDKELKHKMENVIDNLELLSALVSQGIFNEKMAIEAYSGSTALRCWYVLREYIEKVRRQRGRLYCKYLEDFAWRTWDYQKKHSPPDEHIRFYEDKPNESFDLVQYLNDHPELQPQKKT